jgi:non-heme chloroperoxidase
LRLPRVVNEASAASWVSWLRGCIKAFSETDLTEDLKKFDVPTLIAHGDDDQIVPIVAAGNKSSKLVKDATFKVYPGAPHGLSMIPKFAEQFNEDLLAFARS